MPYKLVDIEPEVFVAHGGVTVYHAYKDGEVDRPLSFWYTTDIAEREERQFDVRDVAPVVWAALRPAERVIGVLSHDAKTMAEPVGDPVQWAFVVIRRAIDLGLLTQSGMVYEEEGA